MEINSYLYRTITYHGSGQHLSVRCDSSAYNCMYPHVTCPESGSIQRRLTTPRTNEGVNMAQSEEMVLRLNDITDARHVLA